MATLKELVEIVAEEKLAWDRARIELEKAKIQFEFAQRRLALAKDRFFVEWLAYDAQPDLRPDEADFKYPHDVIDPVRYIGDSIKSACKWFLGSFGAASTEEIVDQLEEGGFQFKSEVPVREVHAALLKQPWAKKDQETGMWEYQEVMGLPVPPSLPKEGGTDTK